MRISRSKSMVAAVVLSTFPLCFDAALGALPYRAPVMLAGYREYGLSLHDVSPLTDRERDVAAQALGVKLLQPGRRNLGGALKQGALEATVRFRWPLETTLAAEPKLMLVNYYDDDEVTTAVVDYTAGDWSYDGHLGTDIGPGFFDEMDKGMAVLAAAEGRILTVHDGEYDRNIALDPDAPANYVAIEHSDGTLSWYYHFRKNSITFFERGEYVRAGQILGFVGSSGYSDAAHLHFEVWEFDHYEAPFHYYNTRDPWEGTNNPRTSLWQDQIDYVGDDHFTLQDLGITTEAAVGGDISTIPASIMMERFSQPTVLGASEPYLAVWFRDKHQAGDDYTVEVSRSDGSIFSTASYPLPSKARNAVSFLYWPFDGFVSSADYGSWNVKVYTGGALVREMPFAVDAATHFAPRFAPLGGKSILLTDSPQEDSPTVSDLGDPIGSLSFSLEGAPSDVSLGSGSLGEPIVQIGAAGSAPRSQEFALLATDTRGDVGRMYYHLTNLGASTLGSPPNISLGTGTTEIMGGGTFDVEVIASDPDSDPIAGITADLSGLPSGNTATFTPAPDNTSGVLHWPTMVWDYGTYPVTVTAQTIFTGTPIRFTPIIESGTAMMTLTVLANPSGVGTEGQVPSATLLDQNQPNPFNPHTKIHFSVPGSIHAVLDVFTAQGQRVVRLLDRTVSAGPHVVFWDGRDARGNEAASGVYLYRLSAAGTTLNRRMVLLR